jgi:hypothetical protein
MFYVRHTDGECDPILRCHVCASRIDEVAAAMVVYPRTLHEGETSRAVIVHGASCLPKAMALLVNASGAPHSIPLEKFLDRLRTARSVAC